MKPRDMQIELGEFRTSYFIKSRNLEKKINKKKVFDSRFRPALNIFWQANKYQENRSLDRVKRHFASSFLVRMFWN